MPDDQKTPLDRKEHWQRVYMTQEPDGVSWYQAQPTVSPRMLDAAGLDRDT